MVVVKSVHCVYNMFKSICETIMKQSYEKFFEISDEIEIKMAKLHEGKSLEDASSAELKDVLDSLHKMRDQLAKEDPNNVMLESFRSENLFELKNIQEEYEVACMREGLPSMFKSNNIPTQEIVADVDQLCEKIKGLSKENITFASFNDVVDDVKRVQKKCQGSEDYNTRMFGRSLFAASDIDELCKKFANGAQNADSEDQSKSDTLEMISLLSLVALQIAFASSMIDPEDKNDDENDEYDDAAMERIESLFQRVKM